LKFADDVREAVGIEPYRIVGLEDVSVYSALYTLKNSTDSHLYIGGRLADTRSERNGIAWRTLLFVENLTEEQVNDLLCECLITGDASRHPG